MDIYKTEQEMKDFVREVREKSKREHEEMKRRFYESKGGGDE